MFDRSVTIDAADVEPTVSWGTSPEDVVAVGASVPSPDSFADPSKRAAASFQAAALGNVFGLVPLLLGHVECPGFTGEPIGDVEWNRLFRETYQLQYAAV